MRVPVKLGWRLTVLYLLARALERGVEAGIVRAAGVVR